MRRPDSNRAKGAQTPLSDCCAVCAASQADDAREAAGLSRKRQKAEEGDAEPTYAGWSTAKWNELETKEQRRRVVEVPKEGEADPKQAALPPGDETRGWHKHWRRGVFGALQSWASGSRGAIVYMLAACALHFGVVKEVCAVLLLACCNCSLISRSPFRTAGEGAGWQLVHEQGGV